MVQIVHVFAEHSGRYLNVVNELVPLGYAVYSQDLRGHGRFDGLRNYVDSLDQYVEDQRKFYDIIKERHQDLPIFILGHSLGSLIIVYFVKKYEVLLKGIILAAMGTSTGDKVSKFLRSMAKIVSRIAPKMKVNPGLKTQMLSHEPEVIKAYEEDPFVHAERITARLGYEMMKNFKGVLSFASTFKIPLLMQNGSEDQLIHGADELKEAFKMEDKTSIIYEGLYHEVYNEIEIERKKVLKDLINWLEDHV
ncbi:MAG: lysophospholipase [Promethearchaeota archaeon]